MKTLSDVVDALPGLALTTKNATDWLSKCALVRSPKPTDFEDRIGHQHSDWRGTFRGEYDLRNHKWWMFCPMWHAGQAIKALLYANQAFSQEAWSDAALLSGDFILRNQIQDGADDGLLLAYEDFPDKITVSAILETLDGLFALTDHTGDDRFADAAVRALQWCRRRAWLEGEGLVQDLYDPATGTFLHDVYPSLTSRLGRPLADDATWLTGYRRSGDSDLHRAFYEILERLLDDESPRGNWSTYGPCRIEDGYIHPRHAYWWGRPFLAAWRDTGDARWLDAARRAGEWYVKAQRIDGGMFRDTDHAFNTRCFGQATSGVLCAAILWMELFDATQDPIWLEPTRKALEFSMSMQLRKSVEPMLQGAIIEGMAPPDGTDRCPYFIRDVASIFFIQAASSLLNIDASPENSTIHDMPQGYAAVLATGRNQSCR